MGKYEDLVEKVREVDEDLASEFEEFTATALRKKAARADELEAKASQLEEQLTDLRLTPKKEAALKAAGVDFSQLRPAEVRAIRALKFEGDEPSEEWVTKQIEELQLPISENPEVVTQTPPNAAAVVNQARNAPTGGGKLSAAITPEQAAEWSTDKLVKFREDHPDEFEALKKGETVVGVTPP